jgi:GST-like protein
MKQCPAIDLYFWPTPNGWKITIMLEECGLPYCIKWINLQQGEQHAAEFLKISPNGRMPAIVDPEGPDGAPLPIFESGAILQYLGDKCGQFYPTPRRARSKVEEWLYWQVGNLGPISGQAAHFRNYKKDKLAYAVDRFGGEVARLYSVMDAHLGGAEYLADGYSIADMAAWPWIRGYKAQGLVLTDYPNLRAWFKRVGARPAVERAANIGKDRFIDMQKRAQSSI